MKNYVQDGEVVTMTAPRALTSGDPCLFGKLVGVATNDAANGADVEVALCGVFDVPKLSTDVIAAGVPVWWDDSNKYVTLTSTGNVFCGHATKAAGNGTTTVNVRLSQASKATG